MPIDRLFDGVPDIVFFVKDVRGRYMAANDTLAKRCGLGGTDEAIGRTRMHARLRRHLDAPLALLLEGRLDGVDDLVMHFRQKDAGLACGDTSVSLSGDTGGGDSFSTSAPVNVKGC